MDLATFGTSFAAGYGEGIEGGNDFSNSYPQHLANLLNVETLYNFSIPVRPIHLLKDDIIEFVSVYKEKHGSTEKLFITFEIVSPHYMSYPTVRSLAGTLLRPAVAFGMGRGGLGHIHWLFSEKWNFKKILDNDQSYDLHSLKTVTETGIVPDDYDKIITATKARYAEEEYYESLCAEALAHIDEMITCLNDHNVRYLGAWSAVKAHKCLHHETTFQEINPESYKKCFRSMNFINLPFTVKSFLDSDQEYENEIGHLTRKGAVAMSDYLFKWIMNNQLLDYKNLDQLTMSKES